MKLTRAQQAIVVQACRNGTKIDRLAVRFNVHPSTIDRVIQRHRDEGKTIFVKRGRPRKSHSLRNYTVTDRERERGLDPTKIDEICGILFETPFPYPERLAREKMGRDIESLQRLNVTIEDSIIRPRSNAGIRTCGPFFPNRYEAKWKNATSALAAWRDERLLRKAVRFQLSHGDPVTPHRVLRAITLLCRTPTIFRPSVAKLVYQRYCPPGGRAWDPCAGYGGRLLGAHVAGVEYVGTDVEDATVDGNRELALAIGSRAELRCARAEDFNPPEIDLVFTSPPYFNRERYSDSNDQSWVRHGGTLDRWIDGFVRPVADRAHGALRAGGRLILNVADLKERGELLPVVSTVTAAILDCGFLHLETLQMPLAAINRRSPTEPILVFRKPT